jgi:hypothetical protein
MLKMTNKDLTEPSEPRPWFFWFTIMAGLIFVGFGLFVAWMIFKYHRLDQYGYTIIAEPSGVIITAVDPSGPAAGKLEPGDKILAINGDARFSRVTQFFWRSSFLQGGRLSLRIERNGAEQELDIRADKYPASQSTVDSRLDRNIAYLPRYLVSLIVALLIGLLKPGDKRARLGACAFLMISHQAIAYPIIPLRGMFSPLEDRIAYFFMLIQGAIWFGPVVYHSAYRFLAGIPRGRVWTALQWSLYSAGAALFLNRFVWTTATQSSRAIEFRSSYYQTERLFSQIEYWYWPLCLLAISAVLIRNNRVVRQADLRRRVRLVLYGSLLPVLPQTAVILSARIVSAAGYESVANGGLFDMLRFITALAMILTPISWGYAILNRQVYDIHVVIRRSVQYLLAQNALRLFLMLPVVGVLYVVVTKSDRPLRELIVYLFYDNLYYLLLIIAAGAGLIYRGRLQDWIDRRFFREAYQQDKMLRELSEEVRGLDSISEMSRLVSQKVDEALHPERLHLFYRAEDKGDLSLNYSTGGSGEDLRIPEEYALLRVMEHQGKALDFPFPPEIKLPQQEMDWLSSLGTSLIVPMNGAEQRLAGLLLLGPKKSEAPYSGSDHQLLDTLANQIAVVYENVRLKDSVARERKIQREVLARVEERKINLLKECPKCGRCYDSAETLCKDDQNELRLSLPVERTIEGKYRLERLLGRGGMGAVYEATDLRLSRQVALKILMGSKFGDQTALRRFEREARASAKLNHPNIIAIHDYGRTGAEGAYLVMELAPGATLRAELKRSGTLPPEVAADWFDQILEGVKAAHGAGVIHRDLKPENVLVAKPEDGPDLVKILDFGLAKLRVLDPTDSNSLTTPGMIMGTLSYMSPEQLTGDEVDERSDLFSLGVMVVEALTGRRPFSGRTYAELLTSILHQPYHLPSDAREALTLDAVLQRCLAKNRQERFAAASEMQKELIPAIAHCPPLGATPEVSTDDQTTSLPTI